jgi:hypothetical protein
LLFDGVLSRFLLGLSGREQTSYAVLETIDGVQNDILFLQLQVHDVLVLITALDDKAWVLRAAISRHLVLLEVPNPGLKKLQLPFILLLLNL